MLIRNGIKLTALAATLAWGLTVIIFGAAAIAAPNSDVYRQSATGPNVAPIAERLDVVRAPEPGRAAATESRLRTVIQRSVKRTDVVESPRTGRGRL